MNKEDIYNSNYEKVRHFKLTLANGETLDLVDMKEYQDVLKKYCETKEVIDKAIEYISELDDNTDDTTCYDIDKDTRDYILSILKEVE